MWSSASSYAGKIVLWKKPPPYERYIRESVKKGAIAVVMIRHAPSSPGFGMFLIDGSNRKDLTIPVVEAQAGSKMKGKGWEFCGEAKRGGEFNVPNGAFISMKLPINKYIGASQSPFLIFAIVALGLWETGIICLAIFRLSQFHFARISRSEFCPTRRRNSSSRYPSPSP